MHLPTEDCPFLSPYLRLIAAYVYVYMVISSVFHLQHRGKVVIPVSRLKSRQFFSDLSARGGVVTAGRSVGRLIGRSSFGRSGRRLNHFGPPLRREGYEFNPGLQRRLIPA